MTEEATKPIPGAPEPAPSKPTPRWAVHRRLYDWMLSLAYHRHATRALFLISFAESSFFPIPPDVLQIAMTLERRERCWYYAAVSTVGSVLGGAFGWLIGWALWKSIAGFFFAYVPGVTQERFDIVHDKFQENAFLAVFTAAFTPIPYKVFTIAGGVFEVSLIVLVVASLLGRGARFFALAGLLWFFGPPVKSFVEKYFNLATVVGGLLVIGLVVLVKVL